MKKFHHLIAAIDFTPSCRRALREAIRRASLDGGKVTAVHVMEDYLVNELKKALSISESEVRKEWENKLRKFIDDSETGIATVQTEVRVGHPYAELVEACHTHHADLLVMGVKGSKDTAHRVGVIAAKCVRDAPVDVLLVRQEALQPFGKVLACVDFSENAAKAVQFALHIAEQDKASMECLHVYQSAAAMALDYGGFVTPVSTIVDENEGLRMWKQELNLFLEPLLRKASSIAVTPLVEESINIRESIIHHVETHNTDLVVVGTRGKGTLRHMLIGTTAEKVVQYAPCSILAVKPDDVVIEGDTE